MNAEQLVTIYIKMRDARQKLQKEFDDALALAKAEIMQIAIETTKKTLAIEREECAKIVDEMRKDVDCPDMPMVVDIALEKLAEKIRNRMKK